MDPDFRSLQSWFPKMSNEQKEASFNWKSGWFIDLAHGFLTLDKKWIN